MCVPQGGSWEPQREFSRGSEPCTSSAYLSVPHQQSSVRPEHSTGVIQPPSILFRNGPFRRERNTERDAERHRKRSEWSVLPWQDRALLNFTIFLGPTISLLSSRGYLMIFFFLSAIFQRLTSECGWNVIKSEAEDRFKTNQTILQLSFALEQHLTWSNSATQGTHSCTT